MSLTNDPNNPYAAPVARIEDLSLPATNELADRGTRLGAFLLDFPGLFLPMLMLPGAIVVLWAAGSRMNLFNPTFFTIAALFVACTTANLVLVFRSQQTIGKRLLGIKVVRSDGSRCNPWRQLLLRGLVPWLLNNIPLVGSLFLLVDPLLVFREDRRCIHDLIADTIVVRA